VDDANPLELRELLQKQKADILVAGVKERFLAYKLGIAFCDFNHDRTTSFEGYDGMVNFAREIDVSLNSPVWKLPKLRASTLGAAAVCSQKELIAMRESGAAANV
jgi:nitrogenase molybdenum-cofactor synthesis protein NifE